MPVPYTLYPITAPGCPRRPQRWGTPASAARCRRPGRSAPAQAARPRPRSWRLRPAGRPAACAPGAAPSESAGAAVACESAAACSPGGGPAPLLLAGSAVPVAASAAPEPASARAAPRRRGGGSALGTSTSVSLAARSVCSVASPSSWYSTLRAGGPRSAQRRRPQRRRPPPRVLLCPVNKSPAGAGPTLAPSAQGRCCRAGAARL